MALRFVPNGRLEFRIPLEGKPPMFGLGFFFDAGPEKILSLTDRGVSFDALCTAIGGDDDRIVFVPKTSGITVTTRSDVISIATFHLFNFPDFNGPEDY